MTPAALPFESNPRRRAALDRLARARTGGSCTEMKAAEFAVVSTHLNFAGTLAARYRDRGLDAEDLRQLAHLGLARAARRWDPISDPLFVRFADRIILGEVKRHLRDQSQIVGLPRSMQQLRAQTHTAARELRRDHGTQDSSDSGTGLTQTG